MHIIHNFNNALRYWDGDHGVCVSLPAPVAFPFPSSRVECWLLLLIADDVALTFSKAHIDDSHPKDETAAFRDAATILLASTHLVMNCSNSSSGPTAY